MIEHEPVVLMDEHFIAKLGVGLVQHDGWTEGSAVVRPEMFAPGTRTIRTGLLATMVDLIAGHTPNGPFGPTVDLGVELFGPAPSEGTIEFECRPLKVGRRLIVGETALRCPSGTVFARATTTFMNVHLGAGVFQGERPILPMDESSFDEFIGLRRLGPGSFELTPVPRLANGLHGTVQGGVQATIAEIAAEDAAAAAGWGKRFVAVDLDIRYLNRIKVGPFVATASVVRDGDGRPRAAVRLTDAGADDVLLGHVTMRLESVGTGNS